MSPNRRSSFTPRSALASLLVLSFWILGSPGCAMFRDPVPPGFQRIALQSQVKRDKQGRMAGDLVAYSTLKGVLVGAVVGAPSLAIAGGSTALGISLLTCTPAGLLAGVGYAICVGVGTIFGLAAGATVGLVSGSVMGGIGGLPSQTAKQVTEVVSRLEENRNVGDDLLAAVRRAVPPEKQVGVADADAVVTARFDEFDLRQHIRDRLSVRLSASMVQEWQPAGEKPKKNTCTYRYTTEKKEAKTWLADGGLAFGQSLTQGLDSFARWMNRDLEAFAAKTELPKTRSDPESCFREPHWYDFFRVW